MGKFKDIATRIEQLEQVQDEVLARLASLETPALSPQPVPPDARCYRISITYEEDLEDGWLYVGRVAEFPDVTTYCRNPKAAYEECVEVIQGLIEMAIEHGHPYPLPGEAGPELS